MGLCVRFFVATSFLFFWEAGGGGFKGSRSFFFRGGEGVERETRTKNKFAPDLAFA